MKDGKFESQEERLRFLEKAGSQGVFLKLEKPGVPCSTIHPEPCLNLATVVHAYYNPVAGWSFSVNICKECADATANGAQE